MPPPDPIFPVADTGFPRRRWVVPPRGREHLFSCGNPASVITGRNEVVAKVMFLQVSVILSTGGGGWHPSMHWGRPPCGQNHRHPSIHWGRPPWDQADPPPGPGRPPRTRQTPWDQADPHGPGRPPSQDQADPPRKQTPVYGQWAASMHPTGMHSCFFLFLPPANEVVVR